MRIEIDVPLPDRPVFRYGAADQILTYALDHPNEVFTNREFRRLTGYGGPSVGNALDLLVDLDLLVVTERGNRTEYAINADRVGGTLAGIAAIPQSEFHAPLRAFRERVLDDVDDVQGIVVFGSVARGEADRRSDVDVFLVVESDPPLDARRTVSGIVADIEQESFDGQRYEFDLNVESATDARNLGERVETLLTEGIPIYSTDRFAELRADLLHAAVSGGEAS